jgi:signal transduction histidine kinase
MSRLVEAVTPAEVAEVLVTLGAESVGARGLCVVAGLVAEDRALELLGARGLSPQEQAAWSRFPLSVDVPVCTAVRDGEELWFPTRGEYLARYPAQGLRPGSEDMRALATLPLPGRDGRPLGAIGFSFTVPRAFGPEERDYLRSLARAGGRALSRARAYAAEAAARAEAEGREQLASLLAARVRQLQGLTAALAAAVTPADVSRVAVEQGAAALGAAGALLMLLTPDGAALEVAGAHGVPAAALEAWRRQPLGVPTALSEAVRTRATVAVESEAAWAARFPDAAARPLGPPGARLALPLLEGERVLGGLAFSFAGARTFDTEERAFLEAFSRQCTVALERSRLLEAERRARQAAEAAAARTRRLQAVTGQLSRDLPAAEVLRIVVDEGLSGVGALVGGLYLLEEEEGPGGPALVLARALSMSAHAHGRFARYPLTSDAPVAVAAATRSPVWLTTEAEYARRFPASLARARDAVAGPGGVPAMACLPLLAGERLHGVLALSFAEGQDVTEAERDFLCLLADDCAQALERRRLRDEERRQREVAQRAERRKDEFLAMLGHELRNPLAPMLTALELMHLRSGGGGGGAGAGQPAPFARERAMLERQARHLMRLVDDLLDVSRIARGKVELRREPVDLARVAEAALESAGSALEAQGHRLTVQLEEGLWVDGDRGRLTQVLLNLLTNAAKYTPPRGEVHLEAAREGGEVVVRVRDTGVGIGPELLPHLFEPFVQGAQTLARSEGGLGLGLAIVHNLAQLHGGRVEAHSAGSGAGSTFTLRLPALAAPPATLPGAHAAPLPGAPSAWAGALARPAAAGPEAAGPAAAGAEAAGPEAAGHRILVVDDNRDAAEGLAEALEMLGHQVRVAHDGPSGLAAAREFRPVLGLLDVGLPVMDGHELAGHIREALGPDAVTLVAVTGYGQSEDRQRALAAGFRRHMSSPWGSRTSPPSSPSCSPRPSATWPEVARGGPRRPRGPRPAAVPPCRCPEGPAPLQCTDTRRGSRTTKRAPPPSARSTLTRPPRPSTRVRTR